MDVVTVQVGLHVYCADLPELFPDVFENECCCLQFVLFLHIIFANRKSMFLTNSVVKVKRLIYYENNKYPIRGSMKGKINCVTTGDNI